MGKQCRNGPHEDRWTCPKCYTDYRKMVTKCETCDADLKCFVELVPMAVCEAIEPGDNDDDDDDD